jgi:multidrug efflux pump subunit AcrB
VGAVLALLLHMGFSIIALIGVFLLGIVKKNAILIIACSRPSGRLRRWPRCARPACFRPT